MTLTAAGSVTGGAPGGGGTGAVGTPRHPGRTTFAGRVFTKIAEQAASQAIGVARGDLSVQVTQFGDGLALDVRTPLPVPRLDDRAAIDRGRPVLERVAAFQAALRDRVQDLTGRDVVRVDVTVTGAVVEKRRRVA